MNTNKSKKAHRTPIYRRPAVIFTFLGLLILVAVIIFFLIKGLQPGESSSSESDPSVAEDDSSWSEETPSVPQNYEDIPETDTWEPKVKQYEGENANQSHELTGSISYQDIDQNKNVTIYTSIDQIISSGSCSLSLQRNNNSVYSTTVSAHADITTSICEPISFSAAQLPSGTYQVEINISGDNKTGIINSEVNL